MMEEVRWGQVVEAKVEEERAEAAMVAAAMAGPAGREAERAARAEEGCKAPSRPRRAGCGHRVTHRSRYRKR